MNLTKYLYSPNSLLQKTLIPFWRVNASVWAGYCLELDRELLELFGLKYKSIYYNVQIDTGEGQPEKYY